MKPRNHSRKGALPPGHRRRTPTSKRRPALCALCWLALITACACLRAEVAGPDFEYRLKAAFLLHFAEFINWPATAFSGPADPLVVGVLCPDAVARVIEQELQSEAVNGHPLRLKRLRPGDEGKSCQMLFISRDEDPLVPALLRSLVGAPVLTVSELDRFCQRGGIINLYFQDKKVRFEINPDQAARANLQISSKVLSLARITKTEK